MVNKYKSVCENRINILTETEAFPNCHHQQQLKFTKIFAVMKIREQLFATVYQGNSIISLSS